MNKIWLFVITVSLCLLIFAGADKALPAMLNASNEALSLSLKLMAVYAVWLGIIKIVEETGISNWLAKILRPFVRLLFGKDIKPDTEKYISVWFSSNLFGMGNAATPMAISAINSMDDKSGRATDGMIMLFVLSASGFQLIPTTVISLRAAAGSASPGDIILPTLITSLLSAVTGVLLVKLMQRLTRGKPPTQGAYAPSLRAEAKQSSPQRQFNKLGTEGRKISKNDDFSLDCHVANTPRNDDQAFSRSLPSDRIKASGEKS
jgi:spore maturation protein A